eukprot:SAG31_NODE_43354_length_267_cov_0.928571_1_plen_25_part_01
MVKNRFGAHFGRIAGFSRAWLKFVP